MKSHLVGIYCFKVTAGSNKVKTAFASFNEII